MLTPADADLLIGQNLQCLPIESLPLAQCAVVTEIDAPFEGDAFSPVLGPQWAETAKESHVAANGLHYSFVTLRRVTPAGA